MLIREPGSHQGMRFSSGSQILTRKSGSCQKARFTVGSQVPEKHFDVLKALISYFLHSNLHLTQLNPNTLNYPFSPPRPFQIFVL